MVKRALLVFGLAVCQFSEGCGPQDRDLFGKWTLGGIQTNSWLGPISSPETLQQYSKSSLNLTNDHCFNLGIEAGRWSMKGGKIDLDVTSFMGKNYQAKQAGTLSHDGKLLDLAIGGSILHFDKLGMIMRA